MDYIYDIETYPNCFTFCAIDTDGNNSVVFECSTRRNDICSFFDWLDQRRRNKDRLVGFNNKDFDYPVVHDLLSVREKAVTVSGKAVATRAYKKAMSLIRSDEKFGRAVNVSDEYVKQVDLFKINHFDNKARSTSLKLLEFNMKSDNIEDLPFPVGTELTDDQIDVLLKYNMHDVKETLRFYGHTLPMLKFREELSDKYKRDFINHNDTKIGKDYFIMRLEEEMPGSCYKRDKGSFKVNQTKRSSIKVADCLFNYYDFQRAEFKLVVDWFKAQEITETKGVFSDIEEHDLGDLAAYADLIHIRKKFPTKPNEQDINLFKQEHPLGWVTESELKTKLRGQTQYSYWKNWHIATTLNVRVGGFRFDFGTGGIHGSIESAIVTADDKYVIIDADVSSMYPNIAIANRVYPEHLSEKFCDIYQDVYEQRKSYPKGSAENAMLKLALNGVYGDSNNQYSPFYDPQYTMTITINGQLSLCLLAEKLMNIDGLQLIQVNTDGVTVRLPKHKVTEYETICTAWQQQVGLALEFAHYSKMFIRDVNAYIAVYTDGKIKRKGPYQYEDLGWHQDQGGLVIPMAAEAQMLHGVAVEDFIKQHKNMYDFMLRTKVPRSSKLVMIGPDGEDIQQQNICRFYACNAGGELIKIMPPVGDSEEPRRISVAADYPMWVCNDIKQFSWKDVDYRYYIDAAKKLVIE